MLDLILKALSEIDIATEKAREINQSIRAIDGGDFPPEISFISSNIETAVVAILDKYIEQLTGCQEMASYYLYEKKGKVILEDGTEYPITTIQELRDYVEKMQS